MTLPSLYLKGDLPGRVPLTLSLADKTGPDALTAALLQMRNVSRCRRRRRHSVLRAARAQARDPGAAGSCSPCTQKQEVGRAAGVLLPSGRPGLVKGLLCAASWAPRQRALATGIRGGAGSVEPSATHGSSHAEAAPETWATQDQQAGKD